MALKSETTWLPIIEAPHDGTEILSRDKDGKKSLAAWCDSPSDASFQSVAPEPGWFRRAEGEWDLFDGYALQEVDPVEWRPT